MKIEDFTLWFSKQFGATPMDFDMPALLSKERDLGQQLVDVQAKIGRYHFIAAQWTAALYARQAFGMSRRGKKPKKLGAREGR